jgi:outer membrane protein OmpA-like peptidoglycan-associated protein
MNLKRLLLLSVSIAYCTLNGFAQDANTRKSCFDDYNFMFTSRGTNPVPNGMQKVTLAVVEANGKSNCLIGQILVKDGNIVLPLYIPREDGSMTETRGKLDNNFYRETVGQIPFKIEEAMSPVYMLEGKRKARLYFIDYLKPEPGKTIDAPVMFSHFELDTTLTSGETSSIAENATSIQFETGKAIITKASYPALDKIAAVMIAHPNSAWLINGYTDNEGNDNTNMDLSNKRANAVVSYFVKAGVKADHLFAAGRGESNPIADNTTAEGRAKNRRVEITPAIN